MQYRENIKNKDSLSALGFGCMRFPRSLAIDMAATEELILSAIGRGVNYFDTAYIYSGSEEALGTILQKNNVRGKVKLATKLPHQKCSQYGDFDRIFGEQKKRLKTDYIDYYLIHNVGEAAHIKRLVGLGLDQWISEKKTSGEIINIGFSFHGTRADFIELADLYEWDFCQIQYNYLNTHYQAGTEGLKYAHEKGLPVIIMEPLLGGKLATSLPKKAGKLLGDMREWTPAQRALRWIFNQPEVTVVLSGMNSIAQLDENAAVADVTTPGSMTAEESDVISTIKDIYEQTYKVSCTGCEYCMPCPKGVNIPGCFAAYNTIFASGIVTGLTQYVTSVSANRGEQNHRLVRCVACGLCETKCPQQIKIPAELKKAKKRLEPFWFIAALKIVLAIKGI